MRFFCLLFFVRASTRILSNSGRASRDPRALDAKERETEAEGRKEEVTKKKKKKKKRKVTQ